MEELLRMQGIEKYYGSTKVLDGASLCVQRGEIHALLGANGAGKSTLMKALFGELPRKGLTEDVVQRTASMKPRCVVYVSCDPATLARDVRRFADLGYAAVRAAAVDMFPRADHVETVVLLSDTRTVPASIGG